MVTITLGSFSGMAPRVSNRLLKDNAASQALNTRLDSGMLRGMREPEHVYTVQDMESPRRIFRVKETDSTDAVWFASGAPNSNLIQSPLVNETLGRWYFFEEGRDPKVILFEEVQNGEKPYRLRVQPPLSAPMLEQHTQVDEEDPLIESRVYVISYVTEWGEETTPSPSATIEVPVKAEVRLRNFYSSVYKPLEGRDFEFVRIYRTIFGQSSSQLFFVADVEWGTEDFVDDVEPAKIAFNTTFPAPNDPPPSGIYGARVHPSGSLVAFKGRDVYFSRPYLPHAWPESWVLSVEDQIVAIEVVDSNVLVLTKGRPVILYGQDVSSMGKRSFPMALPCSNYRAVVAMPEGIYYPSREGLVIFGRNGPQLLTTGLIAQDQWEREFYSEDIVAIRHENMYVATKPNGSGFVLTGSGQSMSLVHLVGLGGLVDFHADKWTGKSYLLKNGEVYRWDPPRGNEVTYKWRSKEFYSPEPVNFSAVQASFELKPEVYEQGAFDPPDDYEWGVDYKSQLLFRAWADGQLVGTIKLNQESIHRLQAGYKGSVWQFEIEGQCPVHSVTVSDSVKGLQNG